MGSPAQAPAHLIEEGRLQAIAFEYAMTSDFCSHLEARDRFQKFMPYPVTRPLRDIDKWFAALCKVACTPMSPVNLDSVTPIANHDERCFDVEHCVYDLHNDDDLKRALEHLAKTLASRGKYVDQKGAMQREETKRLCLVLAELLHCPQQNRFPPVIMRARISNPTGPHSIKKSPYLNFGQECKEVPDSTCPEDLCGGAWSWICCCFGGGKITI